MIRSCLLVLVVLSPSVTSASVKKMLKVEEEATKRSTEGKNMVIDQIVVADEGETVFLPSPSPLPGQPYALSWSRRGKEIFRWVIRQTPSDVNSSTHAGLVLTIKIIFSTSLWTRGWAKPKPKLCARTEIPVFVLGLPEIPAYRLQLSGRKQEDFVPVHLFHFHFLK